MTSQPWRARAATDFSCEKQSATAGRGMVVTNHPLASAAGAEMLAAGGNAVDAAVAAQFALTVVEPMMVGLLGGGMAHIRLADGTHTVIDGMGTAPLAAAPDMYRTISPLPPDRLETEGRENAIGPKSVCVPGNLAAWCEALRQHGRFTLPEVMAPAIRHARAGFRITGYLAECIREVAPDLARDRLIAARLLPGGKPLEKGERLVQADYADSLELIARDGAAALYRGPLGDRLVACMRDGGGLIADADLSTYRVIPRMPIRGTYRGFEILLPPPPASSGVHITQMLNILEAYDLAAMGFGSTDAMHLIAEALKIAFADRAHATGDPDFVDVPVARLTDKRYAEERRSQLRMDRAQAWSAAVAMPESVNTTHLTVADSEGRVVASTQTINSLFGARFIVPGTGMVPNNYMYTFDPHPGTANSIAPGKRVNTSMSPAIVLRDGAPRFALGLPGGLRIFGCVMQAIINMIDHGMAPQEAVEAPRLWTQGQAVEVETGYGEAAIEHLRERGHDAVPVAHVGGGMNAIAFAEDGVMTGAACWRADGTPVGLGGGPARSRTVFWPDGRPR